MENTAMEDKEKEVIRTDDVKVSEEYQFNKFHLSQKLQKALAAMKFSKPSPIQLKVLPLAKSHLDMIIQSKSGTGKTLAFSICLLECYEPELRFPQALVIVPTREIAIQIVEVLGSLGKNLSHFSANEFIGGMDMANDRKKIQSSKIVVGTPGRILHLIKNEIFNTSNVNAIVLDEADKLLEKGQMSKDVNTILKSFNTNRIQIIASTATVTSHLQDVMKKIMKNPIGITPKREIPVLLGIKQFALELPAENDNIKLMRNKIEELQRIFQRITFKQCLLFTNSQAKTETYGNYLKKAGWKNEVINGSQDQEKRNDVLKKLMKYKCRILITTDLMARGIDIENVNLVINLDLPYDCFTYLHRIGRAGRFGTQGIAINLLNGNDDVEKFRKLLGEIGGASLQVLKYPSEKLDYDFWNFESMENETLEKIAGFEKDDESEECNGNVDENLLLLEISKNLVDKNHNQSNSYDLNALLEDYEKNRENQCVKTNGADKVGDNGHSDIFAQTIRDLNLYEDEKIEEIKIVKENGNDQKIPKEKRHVIFKRQDNDDEIADLSSLSSSESECESSEEDEEFEEPFNYSYEEDTHNQTASNNYEAYDNYVAQGYEQWRNIFNFQLANIHNYVKYQH